MLHLRRTATVFVAVLLIACTAVFAAPEPKRQATAHQEVSATDVELPSWLPLRNWTPAMTSSTAAAESQYCTRAIDPWGVACYIGCPDGCSCSAFGLIYMQCCCDVS